MTKKKKIFMGFCISFAYLTIISIPIVTIPILSNNKINLNNQLIDSYKNLFVDSTEEKINDLFFSNNRLNQNITKDQIKDSISFDKNTYLYKEIEKYNQNLNEIDNSLVNEIYENVSRWN